MTDEVDTPADDNTDAAAEAQSQEGSIAAQVPADADKETPAQADPAPAEAKGEGSEDPAPKADGEQKAEGAPENYAEFKIPEGFETLDKDLLAQATPLFKERGLNQDQAQEFVDLFANRMKSQSDDQVTAFTELNNSNIKACKAHPEFGGDKLLDSQVKCAHAIDLMGDNAGEFREMLNQTGLGNNPLLFEFFAKIGGSMTEDGIVDGRKAIGARDIATEMYGKDGMGPTPKPSAA